MCNNLDKGCQGAIKFFIDGKATTKEPQKCICIQPIGFVGNSKDGNAPFGTVADLRVFPYLLSKAQRKRLSSCCPESEFDQPDKFMAEFIEVGLIKLILDDLNLYVRANVKKSLCRVLTYLSSHRDCKAYILRYNGLEKAQAMAQDCNLEIKFEAERLIQSLL